MTPERADEIIERLIADYGHDTAMLKGAIKTAFITTPNVTIKKIATELRWITGIRTGFEQDLDEINRRWPEHKRGSNANRAFTSLIKRVETALDTADEVLSLLGENHLDGVEHNGMPEGRG